MFEAQKKFFPRKLIESRHKLKKNNSTIFSNQSSGFFLWKNTFVVFLFRPFVGETENP